MIRQDEDGDLVLTISSRLPGKRTRAKLERVPRVTNSYHVGRTLEWFRKCGFLAAKVEKRALEVRPGMAPGTARIGPSQDLFGVADILAIPPSSYTGRKGAWFVQVCAWSGLGSHRKKAIEARVKVSVPRLRLADSWIHVPVLFALQRAGNRFLIVSYRFVKAPGGRPFWQRNVEEYLGEDGIALPAGFVDWTPTDFSLLELPRAKKPRAARPRGQAQLPAML